VAYPFLGRESTASEHRHDMPPLRASPTFARFSKFASVHASVYNLFNQERSLSSRQNFKRNRAAALAEWRGLCTA
jgi:putative transposase